VVAALPARAANNFPASPAELLQRVRHELPPYEDESLVRELWLRQLHDWMLVAMLHNEDPVDDMLRRVERAARLRPPDTPTTRITALDNRVDALITLVRELAFSVMELQCQPRAAAEAVVVKSPLRSRKASARATATTSSPTRSAPPATRKLPKKQQEVCSRGRGAITTKSTTTACVSAALLALTTR